MLKGWDKKIDEEASAMGEKLLWLIERWTRFQLDKKA